MTARLDAYVSGGLLIDSGDASGNLDTIAAVKILRVRPGSLVGLHLKSASAARAGTISIRGSNFDYSASYLVASWPAVSFYDGTGALVSSLAVSASTAFDELVELTWPFRFLAVTYADSASGAGSLDVHAVVGGVGGRG